MRGECAAVSIPRSSAFLCFSFSRFRFFLPSRTRVSFFPGASSFHPTCHCSRGKPIAGNTSLGSDRKEGRKEDGGTAA